jgi:predicted nucleic acid-binding protein
MCFICANIVSLILKISNSAPGNLVDNFEPALELYREAFALASQTNRPVCDALYLTLARRKNALFLTCDKKLQALARKLSLKTMETPL